MQIRFNVLKANDVKHLMCLLEEFEAKGVIGSLSSQESEKPEAIQFSDEYVKEHWRSFVFKASGDPVQKDSQVLIEESGNY